MFRLLGSPKTLCDGLTRRDLLHVGGLGAFGLGLPTFLRRGPPNRPPSRTFGQAKACILLFPYGSPPQHETFDPKPDAPAEIQGEMKAIATSVPGLRICERLPRIARVMDRVTVVRSMTHPYPVHGVAYAVSGIPTYTPDLETRPRDPRHWPFIGSVVDYLEERRTRQAVPAVPRNIGLPWLLNSKTDLARQRRPVRRLPRPGATTRSGPTSTARARSIAPQLHRRPDAGVPSTRSAAPRRTGRFTLSPPARAAGDVPVERLRPAAVAAGAVRPGPPRDRRATRRQAFDRYQQTAFSLLTSSKMREALDIGREPLARARALRHDAVRPGVPGGPAAGRGGRASSSPSSGTASASSPAAPGTRTPTTTRG